MKSRKKAPGRRGPIQIAEGQPISGYGDAFQDSVSSRHYDFAPRLSIGVQRIHLVQPVGWCVEVGSDKEAAVGNLTLEQSREVLSDRYQ